MTTEPKKILVVDDEPQILRVLKRSLSAHRFYVRAASDGESALDLFNDWSPDLVITDLSMPLMDGLQLCRLIRKSSQIPIIVLSVRGEEKTKVEALDSGADDYVTKPFGISELLARVRAALRRTSMASSDDKRFELGDFIIDLSTHQAYVRGEEVHLTPTEFELLTFLARNEGKVLTHRNLLAAVWGAEYTQQPEYLRVFLGNMRKKIEINPASPQYIVTEPWIGYRFNADIK